MTRCLLALGANLGHRAENLRKALELIASLPQTRLLARSSWHETAPIGGPAGQPQYLNGAALIATALEPADLAVAIESMEAQLGRQRQTRWDARTIDIDLLLYGTEIIADTHLEIPHPRMVFRQFVLAPAAEIAGAMIHATAGWTVAALLNNLRTAPREILIVAEQPQLSAWLAAELFRQHGYPARDLTPSPAIELILSNQRPALVIALDDTAMGTGPVARIDTADRTVMLREALAAVQAAWPE